MQMAEFNWTVDDIKRAQCDFSNNFMRLDCIRTESYDIAIDCMTECIEKKATDVQPIRRGEQEDCSNGWMCTNCFHDSTHDTRYCPNCGARMTKDGDTNG